MPFLFQLRKSVEGSLLKKVLLVGLAFFVATYSLFLALPFEVDAAAPTFTVSAWKDGQTKVVLNFDQPVHNGANPPGALEASDFAVSGADAISVASAEHRPFQNQVILTLSGNLDSGNGDFLIACASNAVFNPQAEVCGSSTTNVYAGIEDNTAPAISEVFLDGDDVVVVFNDVMNSATLIADNFTLTTAAEDDETITDIESFGEAITIEADGATLAVGAGNTIAASNSVTDAVGNAADNTAFVLLPPLKISEIKAAGTGNARDEYVEIYNFSESPFTVGTNGNQNLFLHIDDGEDNNMALTILSGTIPAQGFYLIGTGSTTGLAPDARYATTDAQLGDNVGVYLSLSATADTNVIDTVGFGTSTVKEGTALANLTAGQSVERKAKFNSNAAAMAPNGTDATVGNSNDSNGNSNDFVLHNGTDTNPNPQNSFSAPEFPQGFHGNEGGDEGPPQVLDSFPSGRNGELVPLNVIPRVKFNKPMDGATITTSTVQLKLGDAGNNLCTSVNYNGPRPGNEPDTTCTLSGPLTASSSYTLRVTTGAQTDQGVALAQAYSVTFNTAGENQTFIQTAAPRVIGSQPVPGANNIPPNVDFIGLHFSRTMNPATFTAANITLFDVTGNAAVSLADEAFNALRVEQSNDAVSIALEDGDLQVGRTYRLTATTNVKDVNAIAIPAHTIEFSTASSNDNTAPIVLGTQPRNNDTGVSVGTVDIRIVTDDLLNPSTVTTTNVLFKQGSDQISTEVEYRLQEREIVIGLSQALEPSTQYTVTLLSGDGGIANASGLDLAEDYSFTFTTGAADNQQPSIVSSTATQNELIVIFSEPMNEAAVQDLDNWTLQSPTNTAFSLSDFQQSIVWQRDELALRITGLSLTAGDTFTITGATSLTDISGNLISGRVASGVVKDQELVGDRFGRQGNFEGNVHDIADGFNTENFGHVPRDRVEPRNPIAGFVSDYIFEIPLSQQIRSNANAGKLILTFPTGFDVSGVTNITGTRDINGPGPGNVAINAVTGNVQARTVTVNFTIATRCGNANTDPCNAGDTHDFLRFELGGIRNSSVPKTPDTGGYSVDIRTATDTTTLETKTSIPFFIQPSGSNTLTVTFGATGVADDVEGFEVELWSPSTGQVKTTSADFSGEETVATFANIPSERYRLRTVNRLLSIEEADDFLGFEAQGEISVSGNVNKTYTLSPTGALTQVDVNVTGATGKDVDVFAFGPGGDVIKRISSTDGDDTVSFKLADGLWHIGVGPHRDPGSFNLPEPPNYILPTEVEVRVNGGGDPEVEEASGDANDGTVVMNLGSAAHSFTVLVQNEASLPISDAKVFLDSPESGFHTFAVTGTNGTATLNMNRGRFRLGSFLDGAPPSKTTDVVVNGAGQVFLNGSTTATVGNVVITLRKGGTAVTGKVTDGTNPVQGGVFAECTANCAGGQFAFTQTRSNGTYQLFLANGTWRIQAHVPGYGPTAAQNKTVSGTAIENVNFSPGDTTFRTITGTVCINDGEEDCAGGTGVSGVFVHAFSPNAGGFNETKTDDNGAFSLRVPSGTGYQLELFDPATGPLPGISGINVSGGNSTGNDIVLGDLSTITINVKNAGGDLVSVENLFVEFVNATTKQRAFAFVQSGSSTTVSLPDGTYKMKADLRGTPITGDSLVSDNEGTLISNRTLTVDGNETVKVVLPTLRTVTVTVVDEEENPAPDTYVELANLTNGRRTGAVTDGNGDVTITVPDGDFQLQGFKPGLVLQPITIEVDGDETQELEGTNASLTITGTVDVADVGIEDAQIKATKRGGGDVFATTDENGDYTLYVEPGEYTINARAYGYTAVALPSPVIITDSNSTDNDITLSTTATLNDPKTQPLTPSAGGTLRNEDTGVAVTIPKNAAGSSSNPGTLREQETNNVADTTTIDVIGNGVELTMTDASGNPVTSFTQPITLEIERTPAELEAENIDTEDEVENLTISYQNAGAFVPESTTITYLDENEDPIDDPADDLSDVTIVRFTAQIDHFTVFTITAPSDGVAPAVPQNVATNPTRGQVVITWDAVTTNADASAISDLAGYEIYRDTSSGGSFTTQVNESDIEGTTFTDTTVTNGTTYFYKVTAADTGGLESTKSAAVSAQVPAGGSSAPSNSGGGGVSVAPLSCTVLSPSSGATLTGGTLTTISWSASGTGISNVNVYYATDGGINWRLIASGQSTSSSLDWSVANTATTQAKIRVECRDGGGATLATGTTEELTIALSLDLPVQQAPTSNETTSTRPEGLMTRQEANEKLPVQFPVDTLVKLPDDSDPTTSVDTAVYYIGLDAKRHPFPSSAIYFSWYADFANVVTIDGATLASIPLGSPVLVRPGTHWVKIQSDPKTYYVAPGYVLRHITDEATALRLGGSDWNKNIIDIEPTFFTKFGVGAAITNESLTSSWPNGALVTSEADGATYLIYEGTRRALLSSGRTANKYQLRFVENTGAQTGWQGLSQGADISASEEALFSFLLP